MAKLLESEYERVTKRLEGLHARNDRIVSLVLTVLGASFAFGFGLQYSLLEVLALAPVALIFLAFYSLQLHTYTQVLTGYARFLEEELGGHAGQDLLQRERLLQRLIHMGPNYRLLAMGALLVTFIMVVLGAWAAWRKWGAFGLATDFLFIGVAFVAFLLAAGNLKKAHDRSYEQARAACPRTVGDSPGPPLASSAGTLRLLH